MVSGIYTISSRTGECLYVGITHNMDKRWKDHLKRLRSGTHLTEFQTWFDAHGEASLVFTTVETFDETVDDSDGLSREVHWFTELQPRFYGHVPSERGKWRNSPETNQKISESIREYHAMRGVYDTPECRWKMCTCTCGKTFEPKDKQHKYCSRVCSARCVGDSRYKDSRDVTEARVCRKYQQGYSTAQIATMENCSAPTVSNMLKKWGIPRRNVSPHNRMPALDHYWDN